MTRLPSGLAVKIAKWSIPLALMSQSCSQLDEANDENQDNSAQLHTSWVTGNTTGTRQHLLVTPIGKQIFENAVKWYKLQPTHRAQPANCALNVSDVLKLTDPKFKPYTNELIPSMESQIARSSITVDGKVYRGSVVSLPRSEAGLVQTLNRIFPGGRVPTGAMFSGCLRPDCSGEAGDGHIGIIGDLDSQGRTQIYHNNWYRPENNGGIWAPFMVSKEHLARGFIRQWMATPWMKFGFAGGKLVSAKRIMPQIDDLDPYNYHTRMVVIPEIQAELDKKNYQTSGEITDTTTPAQPECTVQNADATICAEKEFDVFNANGKKVGVAKPGEPICTRQEKNALGQLKVFFPTPPVGTAYIADADKVVCKRS